MLTSDKMDGNGHRNIPTLGKYTLLVLNCIKFSLSWKRIQLLSNFNRQIRYRPHAKGSVLSNAKEKTSSERSITDFNLAVLGHVQGGWILIWCHWTSVFRDGDTICCNRTETGTSIVFWDIAAEKKLALLLLGMSSEWSDFSLLIFKEWGGVAERRPALCNSWG